MSRTARSASCTGGRLLVVFHGDDDRRRIFDVSRLPLPGWHQALAAAFAERTGPGGGLRTARRRRPPAGERSARLVRFLRSLPHPPARRASSLRAAGSLLRPPGQDRAGHRLAGHGRGPLLLDPARVARARSPLEVLDHLPATPARTAAPALAAGRRRGGPRARDRRERLTTGFSDGELARLLAALRADAAEIRDRIRAGENLLRRYQADPLAMAEDDQIAGGCWSRWPPPARSRRRRASGPSRSPPGRQQLAGQLFVTLRDLPPLMLLAAALTERNGETIKELPARHRLLEDRAVELVIVKRRRGARRWFETVTWEIGPPGRELHTPGGFYLLMLELTARSRQRCGSPLLWCVWRNGHAAGLGVADDHIAPFESSLQRNADPADRVGCGPAPPAAGRPSARSAGEAGSLPRRCRCR